MPSLDEKARQSFDSVAQQYHENRPSYPDALVTDLIRESKIPSAGAILEVGAGTGIATLLFARRGFRVHAIEPGEQMIAVARHSCASLPNVSFECSKFEESKFAHLSFDLLISAQAFHWVDPNAKYELASKALKPSGAIGLFWNRAEQRDPQQWATIDEIYARYFPPLPTTSSQSETVAQTPIDEIASEILASARFSTPSVLRYPWSATYDSNSYIQLIDTYSDHRIMPPTEQRTFYKEIRDAIDSIGGSIQVSYVATLYLAFRKN